MPEVAVFLSAQPIVARTALYLASLAFLAFAGGWMLLRFVRLLDATFGAVASNRDWQLHGAGSKEDVLQLFAIASYVLLLISFEPSIRAAASVMGQVLVTSLIAAPVAGAALANRAQSE